MLKGYALFLTGLFCVSSSIIIQGCDQAVENSKPEERQLYTVVSEYVNLRSKPDIKSKNVTKLYKGATFQGKEESGWIRIANGNWISAKFVKSTNNTNIPDNLPNRVEQKIPINYLIVGTSFLGVILGVSISIGYKLVKASGFAEGKESGIAEGKSLGLAEGYKIAEGEYRIEVIPVCTVNDNSFLFFKSYKADISYFHQLYVKGMPSLKSDITVIHSITKAEINREELVRLAQEMVKAAINVHPSLTLPGVVTKVLSPEYKDKTE